MKQLTKKVNIEVQVTQHLANFGGCTLENGKLSTKTSGYWVGLAPVIFSSNCNAPLNNYDDLHTFIRKFFILYKDAISVNTVGFWLDDDKNIYIDYVAHLTKIETAKTVARACKQVCIYDIANKKELYIYE